jgi:hypothetical protein
VGVRSVDVSGVGNLAEDVCITNLCGVVYDTRIDVAKHKTSTSQRTTQPGGMQ